MTLSVPVFSSVNFRGNEEEERAPNEKLSKGFFRSTEENSWNMATVQ